ncbi:hypothetical protein RAS1_18040 [Phycisphaerae bacterium RAS1]|nr:hypothetical protein RAS1_18040 [Phycisphaerae bacterium RAS1]
MSSDFAWLTEHSIEIYQQYAGKCIAVLDGEIVGVGDTVVEAAEEAEKKHPGANYILEAVDSADRV